MSWIYRNSTLLVLIAILVLAAGLRFYRIDAQSFWHDEGNSAGLAQRDIPRILAGAGGDIHPPGYYLLLAGWVRLFGSEGELPYRSLSAVCGVALVAVIFLLGGRLFGRITGLLAALLAAVNPFQVYYSQEARMYAPMALLGALAILALLLWTYFAARAGRPDPFASALVVLVNAAGLYTHYVFPVIIVVQNVAFLAWWWSQRRAARATGDRPVSGSAGGPYRMVAWWAALQALALVLYAPWIPTAIRQLTTWPSQAAAYDLGPALLDSWRLLVFGPAIQTQDVTIGLIAAGLFLLLSVRVRPPDDDPRGGIALAWLWLLAPAALVFGLGLYKDAFIKFFLVAGAPACLLLARGIVNTRGIVQQARGLPGARWSALLWAVLSTFMLGMFGSQTAQALRSMYFDPAYARDDYRGIAAHIRSIERPDDAILFLAPNQWEVFTFYYPDNGRLYPLARNRPVDPAAEAAELEQIAATHRRLFVLYWAEHDADPESVVQNWLAQHSYAAGDRWYGSVRLAVYGVPGAPVEAPDRALDARFGGLLQLQGYALRGTPLHPGEILELTLFWRVLQSAPSPLGTHLKVFVHLVDDAGALVAQHDAEPGETAAWLPGEARADRHGLFVPSDLAPGTYHLRVGLYRPEDMGRLPLEQGGDFLNLADVQVTAP